MAAKTKLPPIPNALADVAMIDGPTSAVSAAMSHSAFLELVRLKLAPAPVIRRVRYTRWRMSDIRAWLIERAAQPLNDAAVIERAAFASAKARHRRAQSAEA